MSEDLETEARLRNAVHEIEALLHPGTPPPESSGQTVAIRDEPAAPTRFTRAKIKNLCWIVFVIAIVGSVAFLLGDRFWRCFVTTCSAAFFAYCGWNYLFKTREICDTIGEPSTWFPTLQKLYSGPSAYFGYKMCGIACFGAAIVMVVFAIRILLGDPATP